MIFIFCKSWDQYYLDLKPLWTRSSFKTYFEYFFYFFLRQLTSFFYVVFIVSSEEWSFSLGHTLKPANFHSSTVETLRLFPQTCFSKKVRFTEPLTAFFYIFALQRLSIWQTQKILAFSRINIKFYLFILKCMQKSTVQYKNENY